MNSPRFLILPLLVLLALSSRVPAEGEEPFPPGEGVTVEKIDFGKAAWGRNSLRLRIRNDDEQARSLGVRIRSYFVDSGSGVVWEAIFPLLVPPRNTAETTVDYFVRPDHGRLRVEVAVEEGEGRKIYEEAREFAFEAPYRGDYVLQPYRPAPEGVAWETRVLPPFSVRVSERFITYYLPHSEAESDLKKIIAVREKIFGALSRELKVRFTGRIILFLYPDAELARKITGHAGDGWTYGRTIVEVYGARRKIDPHHELVHLLAGQIGSPPVLFSEGLATSREEGFDNAGRYRADVEGWCRGFLREGALMPLSDLMEMGSLGDDMSRPRIAYPESACFVRYLLERHGWEKFREAYASLKISDDPAVQEENLARFRRIYGVSLREMEAGWKQELSRSGGRSVPEEMIRRVVREETVPYLVAQGRQRMEAGSVEEAEDLLKSAAEKDPSDLEAQFWLGQVLHLRGDYAGALAAYDRVIRLGDRTRKTQVAWSRVWSGQILDLLGRRPEALEQYRKAEALQDETRVQVGGRLTTSLEAAREGLARPHTLPSP